MTKTDRQPAGEHAGEQSGKHRGRKNSSASQAGVGGALRSVYDEAVEEAIPKEMLDLLGKLD